MKKILLHHQGRRKFLKTSATAVAGSIFFNNCKSVSATSKRRTNFPGSEWEHCDPASVGLNPSAVESAHKWHLEQAGENPCSAVIVRNGLIAAEWYHGTTIEREYPMRSICKSVYCSMLGIAVAEERIKSLDDRLVDYYPEFMECTFGFGANDEQYITEKDRDITFRQIAAQISGFMEPEELPGEVFHYQTFAMATLMHAISRQYGYYDSSDPGSTPGDGELIARKLRDPIGAKWNWRYMNFVQLPASARKEIFMNYTQLLMTARDMARLGLLWLNDGVWNGKTVIPAHYHREAVRVPAITRSHVPAEDWKYGYGLWVNEYGRLWPNLPKDSYTAAGAGGTEIGGRLIWVCPGLDLVIVQNPAPIEDTFTNLVLQSGLQERIVAACNS